jgi:hypothetical protein
MSAGKDHPRAPSINAMPRTIVWPPVGVYPPWAIDFALAPANAFTKE